MSDDDDHGLINQAAVAGNTADPEPDADDATEPAPRKRAAAKGDG